MKKLLRVAMMLMCMVAVTSTAFAVTFAKSVTSCVDVWADTMPDGSALVHYKGSDPNVISHFAAGMSEYAPDEEADGAVDKWYENGSLFQGDPTHAVVRITKESLALGLRGFNNIDANGAWGPFPHPLIRINFGKNLIFQKSTDPSGSGSENGKGGNHLTYKGDLTSSQAAKFKTVPYRGGYACDGGTPVGQGYATKGVHTKTKVTKYRKDKAGKWQACGDKDPCELLGAIKADTTEIKEIVKDTSKDVKEIKIDVKEIKVDVKEIKTDVKEVKESVGVADKTDAADEKTVQQKSRKTLTKVKHIKKVTNRTHLVTEKMSQDLDDIKAHLKIPKRELQNCAVCHN